MNRSPTFPALAAALACACASLAVAPAAAAELGPCTDFDRRPAILDMLEGAPAELIALFGGQRYEIGCADGALSDPARGDRSLTFRVRYPKDFSGPAAIVLLSNGGYGNTTGHNAHNYVATALARAGFLAINLGHHPSGDEERHRFDRGRDVPFALDALTRFAQGRADGPVLTLPAAFTGTPDLEHVGHTGHSFGGYTAQVVGGAKVEPTLGITEFREPRIDAIVPISPQGSGKFGLFDNGPGRTSWSGVTIPAYEIMGSLENPEWRRQGFDGYPPQGDKFLTIAVGTDHGVLAGRRLKDPEAAQRFFALNIPLFFHTYLRAAEGDRARLRCLVGTLAAPKGWQVERKLDPESGPCP